MAKGVRRIRIFSALEVANICGVVNQTAINWIRNGHLKAFTTPGGQYRIYAKDLAAFLDKRGMSASGEVLQVMMENADWNTFLIAAEQLAGDPIKAGLYGLFREYEFIQACDWFEIGRKFTEMKPGFALIDAELPGADIQRFLHTVKDDPFFGKPYILLLTDNSSCFEDSQAQDANAVSSKRWYPDAILTKPLDLSKLESVMKSLEKHLDTAIIA